jgi:hypothetical protein
MQRIFTKILAVLLLTGPLLPVTLHAQRNKDPLTDAEADQIAELRDQPNERIKLYQKFIQARVDTINLLGHYPSSDDMKTQLRTKYEEFTSICDELDDNLNTFDEAHADIRRALKDLVPAAAQWPNVLSQATPDRAYDFSRKTALDSAQSTSQDAKEIFESQKKYFAEHKDEAGKNGTGPT